MAASVTKRSHYQWVAEHGLPTRLLIAPNGPGSKPRISNGKNWHCVVHPGEHIIDQCGTHRERCVANQFENTIISKRHDDAAEISVFRYFTFLSYDLPLYE